jgi:hypothetical protein
MASIMNFISTALYPQVFLIPNTAQHSLHLTGGSCRVFKQVSEL